MKCSSSKSFDGYGEVSGTIDCHPAGSGAYCYKNVSCSD